MSAARHASSSSTKKHSRVWLVTALSVLALAVVAGGLVVARSQSTNASAAPTAPPVRLTVVSTSPTGTGVAGGSTIAVHFSTDLAPGSPMPTLTPAVAGTWSVLSASLLQYQATGPLVPGVVLARWEAWIARGTSPARATGG